MKTLYSYGVITYITSTLKHVQNIQKMYYVTLNMMAMQMDSLHLDQQFGILKITREVAQCCESMKETYKYNCINKIKYLYM